MLTDTSIMPFGKHQGNTMEEVPASYLKYLYDKNICYGEVKDYIIMNLDVIEEQIKRGDK